MMQFGLASLDSRRVTRSTSRSGHGKQVTRFGRNGKLAPRFMGLLDILRIRVGPVAYALALPRELDRVHIPFDIRMI
ncbi:hypothetical protein LINGRAHAP2_LOCUS10278 [Linum grandiflorum]